MKPDAATLAGVVLPPRILTGAKAGACLRSNLAFALLRLPAQVRSDMLVFYQFCRVLDDLADEVDRPLAQRAEALRLWREALLGKQPLPVDLAGVLQRHHIPPEMLLEIHDGVTADLHPQPFADWASLRRYCERVAVAVGLVSNRITGCKSPEADEYAQNLGLALQLTNILRDVNEDARMGRVYFCDADLEASGVTREEILRGNPGPNFSLLWQRQARRAADFFAAVAQGAPAEDRRALSAAEIMRKLYSRLLRKMEADGAAVWEKRYRLNWCEKLAVLLGL